MNAQSLLHIGHCDEKKCVFYKQKLVAVETSLERSQPHFTAIIYARTATNPEKFAKIGRILSEIFGLEPIVTNESSSDSSGHPRSLKLVPCDRIHITNNFLFYFQSNCTPMPFRLRDISVTKNKVCSE